MTDLMDVNFLRRAVAIAESQYDVMLTYCAGHHSMDGGLGDILRSVTSVDQLPAIDAKARGDRIRDLSLLGLAAVQCNCLREILTEAEVK